MRRLLYAVFGILIIQDICLDVVSCDSSHVGVTFKDTEEESDCGKRRVRRDDLPIIHIETVVILDEDYIRYLNQFGHTTEEQMTEAIHLKWNAVQAEFGKAAVFGYHVYIDIKLIEFWHTNPDWYEPSTRLDYTLYSVCFGAEQKQLYLEYDTIHLYTGIANTDVSGKAYTSRICDSKRKCAVTALTRVTEYVISTHELGHSLGMSHDVDVGCPSPDDGIMGSKTSGWSECSINATRKLLQGQTVECLFETNVDSDNVIELTEAWPGMSYTDDEICELQHGSGHIFRPFPYTSWGECTLYTCWNTNTTSPDFGRNYNYLFPIDGRYCGPRKVCSSEPHSSSFRCITWEETGLDLELFEEVTGGWSDWSSWSECGRTCGTGVRYRQRLCDNPRPKNSPTCNGSRYDAVLCNTESCEGDNEDKRSLIKQRANEVCAAFIETSWYGNDTGLYLSTGDRYHNEYDGQCEVRCDTVSDYSAPTFQRYGLMPDGTPCSPHTQSFVETHELPRNSGVSHHCVQGFCYEFDCEGNTDGEVRKDECGICGGDNSTCDYTHELFNKTLGTYVRETIVKLPPEAFLIQFYFDYGNMETFFMELWTEDNNAIIASYEPDNGIFSTKEVPVTWAGTRWHFEWGVQYLYADDAINTTAVVKVNSDGRTNRGIFYSFSVPKDTGVIVGENCTNTFCRDAYAVCDAENRCSCKTGYVYNTTHCADRDECSEGVPVCANTTSGGRCTNTEGSFVCSCIEGFTGDGYSVCEDVDECDDNDSNACVPEDFGGRCVNTLGSYTCSCDDGYTGDGLDCTDVDECDDNDLNACVPEDFGGRCVNTLGSYTCSCGDGYTGDGLDCTDRDECSEGVPVCAKTTSGGRCTNTEGSFVCSCIEGFTGDGYSVCEDVDECDDNDLNACVPEELGGRCVNMFGSYTCSCGDGYTGDGLDCTDRDECSEGVPVCANTTSGGRCTNTEGSFVCSCIEGFTGYGYSVCEDVDECDDNDLNACVPEDFGGRCVNTLGSYTCSCGDGYTGDGLDCTDRDECSGGVPVCANTTSGGRCTNTEGSFVCSCIEGFTGDGYSVCEDVDECDDNDLNACVPEDFGGRCVNTLGSYTCSCDDGYTGDGLDCTDVDECDDNDLNTCTPEDFGGRCVNTLGSYTCSCDDGYTGDGLDCTDRDECSEGVPVCANTTSGGRCTNTEGSFVCSCIEGFTGDGYSVCEDVDECDDNDLNACVPEDFGGRCVNTLGSYTCSCDDGYTGDGLDCTDRDECSEGVPVCANTTSGGRCTNTEGSFVCSCIEGFTGDGYSVCEDVDECDDNDLNACVPEDFGGRCVNTLGSYTCSCDDGYTGDGLDCTDRDECSEGVPVCANTTSGGRCTNTEGSFVCSCIEGFTGDGYSVCEDVDECDDNALNACVPEDFGGRCVNMLGSYTCSCDDGYTGDGLDCTDRDECSEGVPVCANTTSGGRCTNTEGSFVCSCIEGFTGDGYSVCEDVDECDDNDLNACVPEDFGGRCVNMLGSYTCSCDEGYTGDGLECTDVDECDDIDLNTCIPEELGGRCVNTLGSYTCSCDDGYTGDGLDCTDVDECDDIDLNTCIPEELGGRCVNTEGSYTCSCGDGYTGDGSYCTDTGVIVGENCLNTFCRDAYAVCDAEHRCSCKTGYFYTTSDCADGDECDDIDLNRCIPVKLGGRCVNTEGSYTCSCDNGYTGDGCTLNKEPEVPVYIQDICIGIYMLLIVLVFIHCVFYLRVESCTGCERVYSYISMAVCAVLLLHSILYLITINIEFNQTGCRIMSLFIQFTSVGYFIVVWISSVTTFVLMRLYNLPRYLIPIAVFLSIGIAAVAIIICAIMTDFDGFYLEGFCWYDIDHSAFKTSSITIAVLCICIVALNITLLCKVKTDSKDPSERLQHRFHRSLLRRNIVYVLWHCVVWVLQVVSANIQTMWIQVVFLVVLNIEGVGMLASRLFLFSYICRKTVLQRKTKDIDHCDFPEIPDEPGSYGDIVVNTELGAQYKTDTKDVFLEVDGVTHI